MENASKALIIAGAILISIILISVGIMVVQSAGGIVDQGAAGMTQQEIQAFNANFLNYAGTQRGSTVRTLLQTVMSSNSANPERKVTVNTSLTTNDQISEFMSGIKATDSKTVKVTVNDTSGLVTNIDIS